VGPLLGDDEGKVEGEEDGDAVISVQTGRTKNSKSSITVREAAHTGSTSGGISNTVNVASCEPSYSLRQSS
jgi:hypothetical protein